MAETAFLDSMGRLWDLTLNIPALGRLDSACGVKLSGNFDGLGKLSADPCRFADALTAILTPQLERAGVTTEGFAEALDGNALNAASDAFVEATLQFMPAKKAALLRTSYEKALQVEDAMIAEVTRLIATTDLDKVLAPAVAG